MLHDVFICHASEDKERFVRPLAELLLQERVAVWYDEFSLNVGDSLRRSIDRGLSQSRFGIVVLSPSFFEKHWSQWELDGLVSRQNAGEETVLLPIWHGVSRSDVAAYSLPLADKVAATSDLGLAEVVRRLLAAVHPRGSTLVVARDHLIAKGISPPVVTDDWWLDIAAVAESNDQEGGWQEPMGWGRWGFPLPPPSDDPSKRGWRLARAAMQDMWQDEADSRPITQITRPELVHEFIASAPGLREACVEHVRYLISYAPQLVIRGFGGDYENAIETMYQESVRLFAERRTAGDRSGSALTVDGPALTCADDFALRDPEFGMHEPGSVACGVIQGNYVANGPPIRYYYNIDYAAWTLSEESQWMPVEIRDTVRRGIAEWGRWFWFAEGFDTRDVPGFDDQAFTGRFATAARRARSLATLRISGPMHRDLEHRLGCSARWLRLPEDGMTLASRFLDSDFLECYFKAKAPGSRSGQLPSA